MTNLRGTVLLEEGAAVDAAGRIRTSELTTLGEYKGDNDNIHLFSTETNNGGAAYNGTESSYDLSLSGSASGDYGIIQTRQFHNYFSGKSQLIEVTLSQWGNETNVTKRCGYYSTTTSSPFAASEDGFWVENRSGTLYFEGYKNGTQKWSVDIDSWANENGVTIDRTKFLVFAFDFLYLGGTSVKLWIKIEGKWYLIDEYTHANEVDGTFIQYPAQPIRAEIRSTGAYTGTPLFRLHCAQVATEGSINQISESRVADTGTLTVDANATANWYLVVATRLKAANRHSSVVVNQVSTQATTNDDYEWALWINPTVAGDALVWTDIPDSRLQQAIGNQNNPSNNTITGGIKIEAKYAEGNDSIAVNLQDVSDKIGSQIDGTLDEMVLAVRPRTTNLDIRGLMVLRSYT